MSLFRVPLKNGGILTIGRNVSMEKNSSSKWLMSGVIFAVFMALQSIDLCADESEYFTLRVIDEETGRGVPLVELKTVNNICHYTDSNGVVAFREPALMGRRVFFHVSSHGYEYPKDGFGYRGRAFEPNVGGKAVLELKRLNVAERLYRMTGAGIYRDSILAGVQVPTEHPTLNALVFGSDSVVNTVYRGRVYWFWGDTNRPAYPLGNFHVPGATSLLPKDGGLNPAVGVNLEYFVGPQGFAKEMAHMPGDGPTWIGGLANLKSGNSETLVASYVKVRKFLEVYQHGLVRFDDDQEKFVKVCEFPMDSPVFGSGHTVTHHDGQHTHVYFCNPFPTIRVRATLDAMKDIQSYEAYTPLRPGAPADDFTLLTEDDRVSFAWRRGSRQLAVANQIELINTKKLEPRDAMHVVRDIDTGNPIQAHGGSVYWNAYRKRWISIMLESLGSSPLGEIWYSESESIEGPWRWARKIASHRKYSFYNPKQHPMFDQDGGRIIYFEGTYTTLFSGNSNPTPRYDYNQIMYRLDLSRPELVLPTAWYRDKNGVLTSKPQGRRSEDLAFYACDRPGGNTIAVKGPDGAVLFHGLPLESRQSGTVVLFELRHRDATQSYWTTHPGDSPSVYENPRPLARVWKR